MDQLKLWQVAFEPAHEEDGAAVDASSGSAQMADIRQMLQQSTLDASLQSEADPKKRFMHALAAAALRQVMRMYTRFQWQDSFLPKSAYSYKKASTPCAVPLLQFLDSSMSSFEGRKAM